MFNKGRFFLSILVSAFLIIVNTPKAFAVDVPDFPLCSNPRGDIVASYDNGIHGVVGDTAQYTGKDTVYSINENQLVQCLCTNDGRGIQTNWWKASSLTEDQIDILESEGWILVADGSAWGLVASPYLAKNSDFSCNITANNAGGSGGGDGRSDGKSDGRSDGRSDGMGGVLGLATTGNYVFILGVVLTGLFFLSTGLLLRFRKGR
ncbi:MAG: hypothetical protein AAB583_06810 [Patescibacteria group bacterium]